MYFDIESEFSNLKAELNSRLKDKMREIILEKVNNGEYTLKQGADLEELMESRGIENEAWSSSSAYC